MAGEEQEGSQEGWRQRALGSRRAPVLGASVAAGLVASHHHLPFAFLSHFQGGRARGADGQVHVTSRLTAPGRVGLAGGAQLVGGAAGAVAAPRPGASPLLLLGGLCCAAAAARVARRASGDKLAKRSSSEIARKRRRKDMLLQKGKPKQTDLVSRIADGDAGSDKMSIASQATMGLVLTKEEKKRQKAKRLEIIARERQKLANSDDDWTIIQRVIKSEEPSLFETIPYIWVQLSHVILGGVCLGSAVGSVMNKDAYVDFVFVNLPAPILNWLLVSLQVTLLINFVVACYMAYEEKQDKPDETFSAFGWFIKGLLLGGVANWQRKGRIQRKKEMKEEKDKETDDTARNYRMLDSI